MFLLLAKDLILGWSCFSTRKRARKIWKVAPLCLFWAIWIRRNHIVFDDMPFSLSMLKTSFLSILVSWARSIELEECSIIRIVFVHYIGFPMGGRFFPFFLYRSSSSLYTMGLLSLLLFLLIYIFAQFTYQKKKKKKKEKKRKNTPLFRAKVPLDLLITHKSKYCRGRL